MIGQAEKTWFALIGLTFLGAVLGETGNAGWPLSLTVASLIYIKSSIVVDQYMEMRSANKRIRTVLRIFFIATPILIIITFGWHDYLRELTSYLVF